ncbi:MAG TPA: oxidoreductase, partial [bacterium]|nr:oxidoreductase [bacterium]
GALCPSYQRGCFACFGPKESSNTSSLSEWFAQNGMKKEDVIRAFRGFNAYAEPFRRESEAYER